jgi:hypothetical protein
MEKTASSTPSALRVARSLRLPASRKRWPLTPKMIGIPASSTSVIRIKRLASSAVIVVGLRWQPRTRTYLLVATAAVISAGSLTLAVSFSQVYWR